MDQQDMVSLILKGCKVARGLESNLPNLANQPGLLINFCDDIVTIFSSAKEKLLLTTAGRGESSSTTSRLVFGELEPPGGRDDDEAHAREQASANFQEWLRSSYTQAMDIIYSTQLSADQRVVPYSGYAVQQMVRGVQVQAAEVLDSGKATDTPAIIQRPRKRKDDAEKRTIRVAAPQIGNTEIPPEDGNTWRKYGQKEILGSRFPRGYYRCTHQKLYQCPAKKQVQRLDDDPYTFEVTYRGSHTCHMSSTAPSVPPPPPLGLAAGDGGDIIRASQEMNPTMSMANILPQTSQWLSMAGGASRSSSHVNVVSRFGKEAIEYPVADMADVMFNSGSSSTNSMDLIFPSIGEDKWDQPGPAGDNNI